MVCYDYKMTELDSAICDSLRNPEDWYIFSKDKLCHNTKDISISPCAYMSDYSSTSPCELEIVIKGNINTKTDHKHTIDAFETCLIKCRENNEKSIIDYINDGNQSSRLPKTGQDAPSKRCG